MLVKTACSTATSFSSVSLSVSVYKLTVPFGTLLMFLLGLLSAVLVAVIFRHLATCVIVLFCLLLFYWVFLIFFAPWSFPSRHYCFYFLGCHAVLYFSSFSPHFFSRPFLILAAIFISKPFSLLPSILSLFSQTAINTAFHTRLGPFFCWVAIFALVLSSP